MELINWDIFNSFKNCAVISAVQILTMLPELLLLVSMDIQVYIVSGVFSTY